MAGLTKLLDRTVTLTGITELLFDRYPGDNKTVLTDPGQKLYLDKDRFVCMPAINILSFLSALNTESATRVLLGRNAKPICSALLSSVTITPSPLIKFTRDGKPIKFGGSFNAEGVDPVSGITVVHHVARLDKGIPNPKERPMLETPWTLEFRLRVMPHPELTPELIENVFADGGMRVGLGTYRKAFGKFEFSWK